MESKSAKSPFALALAARRKEIPLESLSGAAKILHDDSTLTQEALKDYANLKRAERPKGSVSHTKVTFKRG